MEAVIDLPEVLPDVVDASVGPRGSLENLSQSEIESLLSSGGVSGIHSLFRKCALAVLNSGSDNDNAKELFDRYADFDVEIVRHPWGIRLEIHHAPANAFVDGQMIRGIKEHLFAVLRDVVYIANEIVQGGRFTLTDPKSITNAVFHVLRNAQVLNRRIRPNLVVCWGGHSINETEYQYSKRVGYEMGLRGLDVFNQQGWMAVVSLLPLLAISAVLEPGGFAQLASASWIGWFGALYAAFASSLLGHGLYYVLVKRHPVAQVTPWLLLVPVFAVALGIAFWGDRPGPRLWLGGAMVLGGVFVIALRTLAKARTPPLAEPL